MVGYVRLSRIFSVLLAMVMRVWAYSGLVLFLCFLLYYLYGGIFAFLLLIFAATGKVEIKEKM